MWKLLNKNYVFLLHFTDANLDTVYLLLLLSLSLSVRVVFCLFQLICINLSFDPLTKSIFDFSLIGARDQSTKLNQNERWKKLTANRSMPFARIYWSRILNLFAFFSLSSSLFDTIMSYLPMKKRKQNTKRHIKYTRFDANSFTWFGRNLSTCKHGFVNWCRKFVGCQLAQDNFFLAFVSFSLYSFDTDIT